MLAKELKELEAAGLVTRKVFAEVPPRVEYATTEACLGLLPGLKQIDEWGRALALGVGAIVMAQPAERPRAAGPDDAY
jgi:DNA-binding HxlR family transcriptional regulator